MSGADSIEAAARGELPRWTRAGTGRREHMQRVAELMGTWALRLAKPPRDVVRWRAAGWLHDALRDAEPAELRRIVDAEFRSFPARLLHGPAAAALLRRDGVQDDELLRAIAWHTVGHPEFGELGAALYLADFLEPGRIFQPGLRAALRARMPDARERVLGEVAARRLGWLIERGSPLRPESVAFWNRIAAPGPASSTIPLKGAR